MSGYDGFSFYTLRSRSSGRKDLEEDLKNAKKDGEILEQLHNELKLCEKTVKECGKDNKRDYETTRMNISAAIFENTKTQKKLSDDMRMYSVLELMEEADKYLGERKQGKKRKT